MSSLMGLVTYNLKSRSLKVSSSYFGLSLVCKEPVSKLSIWKSLAVIINGRNLVLNLTPEHWLSSRVLVSLVILCTHIYFAVTISFK